MTLNYCNNVFTPASATFQVHLKNVTKEVFTQVYEVDDTMNEARRGTLVRFRIMNDLTQCGTPHNAMPTSDRLMAADGESA